ncbi:MAG TPA: protein-disulfide reductase DsbD domain-containing protein [Chitinophagaceae bacterium]|jgi:thiol:disulfide interchange protein DsbD|nr:protein-disulfide reductase DsbD domain-containing protein [Chitinophagaceae bacterium]
MKAALLNMFLFATMAVSAQNPVTWNFTSKKLADNSYEIHMTATIEKGWHLYSQVQPDDAVAGPTTFSITNNPLIELSGKIKEVGKMQKFHDKELEISANQYSEKVDFVQIVKLKGKVKTSFSGSVEYQTCDDKKCLPPKTVNFKVALDQ